MLISPRVLMIATSLSENGIHTARALCAAGFEVAVHSPSFHLLTKIRGIQRAGAPTVLSSTESAIRHSMRQWRPDVVVPCDDTAVRALHRIHRTAPECSEVIARSLGDPSYFPKVGSRVRFLAAMANSQARVPEWVVLHQHEDVAGSVQFSRFPQVLKREGSGGGAGVRIVCNEGAARTGYAELTRKPSALRRLQTHAMEMLFGVVHDARFAGPKAVIAQRYVHGQAANRSVFCWKGQVLAGINVEVVHSYTETTPATVVKRIDHVEMDIASAAAVRLMKISGFCGFDFVLEQGTRRAWLLEMNPRLTSISHLPFGEGSDLIAAMAATCSRSTPKVRPRLMQDNVALFPHEVGRDPHSLRSLSAYHDVPWDDLELVSACLHRCAKLDAYGRVRNLLALGRHVACILLRRPEAGTRTPEPFIPTPASLHALREQPTARRKFSA